MISDSTTYGQSDATSCSIAMHVWAGPLVPGGAKRLAKLIARHGGIPRHAWKCPECGGEIQADDDGGIVKNQWRYAIGCKEQDCIGVIGPSVKAVIRMWVAECEANAAVSHGDRDRQSDTNKNDDGH